MADLRLNGSVYRRSENRSPVQPVMVVAQHSLWHNGAVGDQGSSVATGRQRLSDALVEAGRGSEDALAEVYRASSAKLFGICLRILGSRHEAEDALQDVYINVWRKAASFDPERASPITWLAVLARNRSIDRLRSRGSRVDTPIEAAAEVADPAPRADAAIAAGQERARLQACIAELEQRQAGAIRAAFFDGLTYGELAAREDVPAGTMKSWIRRGLLRLKDCLQR